MRITIVQGAFLPVPAIRGGAVEKRWHRLGIEFSKAGKQVLHISRLCDQLLEREHIKGVSHIRIRGYDTPKSLLYLKFLDGLYSLRARSRLNRQDILISNTFWMPILLRNQQKWGKVIVDFARMPKGQVRFYKHVACIRVNSQAVKNAILKECPEVEPIVRFIPNPLPFHPPEGYPIETKEQVLLYAGRIHPEKGLDLLADAWRQISPSFPNWKLEIAGPHATALGGGGDRFFEELKNRFGDSKVHWHGAVNEPGALEKLYARSKVFVYPSVAEKGETFGLAPLEAMAYGATPIVSALECFQEFIEPGKNGIVFNHRASDSVGELELALKNVLSNDEDREKIGELAFQSAKAFAPDVIAQRFIDLFEELTVSDSNS